MDPEIRKHIQSADWPRITKELAIFARHRVKITFGRTGNDPALPKGFSVEGIVQEAVKRFLGSIREWHPEKVELLPFLKGVVKSVVSHLVELKENELTERDKPIEEHFDLAGDTPNPEESLTEEFRRSLIAEAYARLLKKAETNREYEGVALCIMDGIDKPTDIAGQTGVEITRVNYLKKCWKRDYEVILRDIISERKL